MFITMLKTCGQVVDDFVITFFVKNTEKLSSFYPQVFFEISTKLSNAESLEFTGVKGVFNISTSPTTKKTKIIYIYIHKIIRKEFSTDENRM